MTSGDEQKVENAYLDAISILADIIGLHDESDGVIREPSVDLDRLPAPVVNAGRYAISMLAVGVGILDPDSPAHEDDFTAEQMLAAWMGGFRA
jgi:hypothetical protein